MNNIELFRKLVTAQNEQITTTSRKIAELFGKRHADILRRIDNLDCGEDFTERNFAFSYENNDLANGKPERLCAITRDGMAYLVMGFTGKKAAEFKVAYINAFNWMAEMLRKRAEIDFMMGDFSRREAESISNGSFHGRGLAKRRIEKHDLSSELKQIESKLQMVLELVSK